MYIEQLEAAYDDTKISGLVTRADFWILCSIVAIEEGRKKSGKAGIYNGAK